MRRYYFDMREGDDIAPDEEGLELSSIKRAQEEAARSLADMARDAVPRLQGGVAQDMAIEVRDADGPVLKARLTLDISRLRRATFS